MKKKMEEVRKLIKFVKLKDPVMFARIRAELAPAAAAMPQGLAALGEDEGGGFWDQFVDKVSAYAGESVLNAVDKQRLNAQTDRAKIEAKQNRSAASLRARDELMEEKGWFTTKNIMIGGGILAALLAFGWWKSRKGGKA